MVIHFRHSTAGTACPPSRSVFIRPLCWIMFVLNLSLFPQVERKYNCSSGRIYQRKNIVPTWNSSQQGLSIIVNNQVLISGDWHFWQRTVKPMLCWLVFPLPLLSCQALPGHAQHGPSLGWGHGEPNPPPSGLTSGNVNPCHAGLACWVKPSQAKPAHVCRKGVLVQLYYIYHQYLLSNWHQNK